MTHLEFKHMVESQDYERLVEIMEKHRGPELQMKAEIAAHDAIISTLRDEILARIDHDMPVEIIRLMMTNAIDAFEALKAEVSVKLQLWYEERV